MVGTAGLASGLGFSRYVRGAIERYAVTVGMSAACDVSSILAEVHTSGNMRPVDSDMQNNRVVPCSVVTRPLLLACVLYICTIKTEFLDQRVYMLGVMMILHTLIIPMCSSVEVLAPFC